MAYLGREPQVGFTETVKDSFNGDNSTTAFTMSQSVSLDTDIEVFVGNVQQEPGSGKAYTVSGTTLTFSEAPPTGTANIYVVHRNSLQGTILPPQNLGDRNYLIGGNLSLDADSAVLNFGADSEITVTHVADTGLNIKHTATGDDKPVVLTLQTGETDIQQDDVLGTINFQAPDEGTGTDAILVAAGISAVSEGDFSSSSNATKLVFKTGSSEAASEKMSLSSAGLLTIADDLMIKDGGTIGVASTNDAITISSAGIVTFKDDIIIKDAGTIGSASDTDAISISSGGVVNISATTANTSASDGALTVAGGLGVALDASIGDDLRLISDSAVLSFGADSEIQLIHVADDGLILKHIGTGDGKEPSLTFQAGDNDIAQDDLLGSIQFQAPDEGAGTDAILVAAGIDAQSEGDFSSSSNATSLRFLTGASETATAKMKLSSGGNLSLVTDSVELAFGNDSDVKLTHVADTGLILAAGGQTTSNFGTPANGMKDFVIGGDGNVGMSILTTANNNVRLAFGDVDDPDEGQLNYDCNVGTLAFQIDGDQAFKMHNLPDGTFLAAKLEAQGGVSVADESSVTFRAAPGIVVVSNRTNGSSAAYHVDYINSSPTELSDPNSDFRNDDADGFICVIKSSNSYDISVKNRAGASKAITAAVFSIDF